MYITDGLQIECEFINALSIDYNWFHNLWSQLCSQFFFLSIYSLVEVIKIVWVSVLVIFGHLQGSLAAVTGVVILWRLETLHLVFLARVPPAVNPVHEEASGHPDWEPDPGLPRELGGQHDVGQDGAGGQPGNQRHRERGSVPVLGEREKLKYTYLGSDIWLIKLKEFP